MEECQEIAKGIDESLDDASLQEVLIWDLLYPAVRANRNDFPYFKSAF